MFYSIVLMQDGKWQIFTYFISSICGFAQVLHLNVHIYKHLHTKPCYILMYQIATWYPGPVHPVSILSMSGGSLSHSPDPSHSPVRLSQSSPPAQWQGNRQPGCGPKLQQAGSVHNTKTHSLKIRNPRYGLHVITASLSLSDDLSTGRHSVTTHTPPNITESNLQSDIWLWVVESRL